MNEKENPAEKSTVEKVVGLLREAHDEAYAKGYQDGKQDGGCHPKSIEAFVCRDPWADGYAKVRVIACLSGERQSDNVLKRLAEMWEGEAQGIEDAMKSSPAPDNMAQAEIELRTTVFIMRKCATDAREQSNKVI